MTKFDTPVRIALKCLDYAQIGFTRRSGGDTAFLEVLSRLSRRVNKERERLRTKVKSITSDMYTAVSKEGTILARAVGNADFESLNKQSEINVRQHYERAGEKLEEAVRNAIESIRFEVESELGDELTQAFVAQLNFDSTVSVKNLKTQANTQQIKEQINYLRGIGEEVGVKLLNSSTRGFVNTAGEGFLRSRDVIGSASHKAVYTVGKMLGFKFKPFQAVGIAKNIGNAAKFLGPALSLISVAADIYSVHQERQHEQRMSDIRRDITSQFQANAVNLTKQIEEQLQEAENQLYGQIEGKITEARRQNESVIANSQAEVRQLAEIRKSLEGILEEVQKMSRVEPV